MRKKKFDVTKLRTIKNFAAGYINRQGKPGVSRQYIEALISTGRNKGFDLVMIDGMKFIQQTDPEISTGATTPSSKKTINKETVEAVALEVNNEVPIEDKIEIVDPEPVPDVTEELVKPATVKKSDLGEKPDVSPNQLSMF